MYKEKSILEETISRMTIVSLDDVIIKRAIALRQKRKMELADAIIAATALEHNLPLVTRNVEDYKHVPGLKIINPFDA